MHSIAETSQPASVDYQLPSISLLTVDTIQITREYQAMSVKPELRLILYWT
jgi:hypothetical protein